MITQDHIEANLLSATTSLFNHIHCVEHSFAVEPSAKKHRKACINYTDIKERRDDFLRELLTTAVSWVYSKAKTKEIIAERAKLNPDDEANAFAFLTLQALSKFRKNHPQGQFGELLLFNFIQHIFKAAPMLRKQTITTSVRHERYGSDAIHFKRDNEKNVIILGESKCYESKYKFASAFEDSLKSIVKSFESLDAELGLYTYENFIEPDLIEIAKKYKEGTLSDVRFELVCIIAYNETNAIKGQTEAEIKAEILEFVEKRCDNLGKGIFGSINTKILQRMHYIFFPIFELEKLLDAFDERDFA